MSGGRVIERGVICGKPYRVWRCWDTGKKIVYWGLNKQRSGQVGRRRSMGWLRKHKKREDPLSGSAK